MKKKVFTILLASALALSMMGCASGKATTEEPAPAAETEETGTAEGAAKEDLKETGAETGKTGTGEETGAGAETADGQSTKKAADDAEEAADITDLLGSRELEAYAGRKIAIRNVTSVDTEDPGGDLLRFLYDTDGNGLPGSDLYFSIEKDGETYLMVVTSDEYDTADGAYQAVEGLEEDAVIDLEGYLYPEGEPVARITKVTVH